MFYLTVNKRSQKTLKILIFKAMIWNKVPLFFQRFPLLRTLIKKNST